jgi:hypothetical protein
MPPICFENKCFDELKSCEFYSAKEKPSNKQS